MGKYLFLLSESELARTTDNATPIKEEIKTEYDISIILVGQSWLGLPIMQYLNYFTLLNGSLMTHIAIICVIKRTLWWVYPSIKRKVLALT